jgi:putative membrane protein insertion efficiency factor
VNPFGPDGGPHHGPGGGPGGPYHQQNPQRQPPPPRRGWLRRNWKWYDRYCNLRDLRNQSRPRRSNDSADGGDGCGCDGCGCDLFHLSVFQVLLLATPTRPPHKRVTVPGRAGLAAIRGYQRWVSHRLPTCCPHAPSCSHYGLAVVRRYGLFQGARLAGGRIARCTSTVPHGTADPPP